MRAMIANTTKTLLMTLVVGLLAVSCGKQPNVPKIDGVQGPFFHVQDGRILISMTLETVEVTTGGRVGLGPELPNSFIEVTPAQFGGTFFQVALDYTDLERGNFKFVDPQALPGGRPLPGVVGGELPALAIEVGDLRDTVFYVSNKVFGFFVHFKKLKTQIGLTQRLYLDGASLGNISLVGADQQGKNAGLLLMLNLDAAAKKKLKRLVKYSKKKRNRGKKF